MEASPVAQVETEFVGSPLRSVGVVGLITFAWLFDHRKPGRTDQIPKIIDDDFLLSRIEQIEAANQETVDDGANSGDRDGGGTSARGGARQRCRSGAADVATNSVIQMSSLGKPRIEVFKNLRPKVAVVYRFNERIGKCVEHRRLLAHVIYL